MNVNGERGYLLSSAAGRNVSQKYYAGVYASKVEANGNAGYRHYVYPLRCLAIE